MTDFVIDDASGHFAASKNLEYRRSVALHFEVFITFLQSHGLTTRTILAPGQAPDESLKIKRSDLTDEGFVVVQKSYDKWLRGIDNGKAIDDVSLFEKSLQQVRDKQRGNKGVRETKGSRNKGVRETKGSGLIDGKID